MRHLSDRILVCFTMAFAVGLALAEADARVAVWVLSAAAVAALALRLLTRRAPYLSAAILLLAALSGALRLQATATPAVDSVDALPEGGQTLVGTVAAPPAYRGGVWSFVLETNSHLEGEEQEARSGRCLVRYTSRGRVQRGQRWRLTGRLRRLSEARNPGGRSEARRLASLGVRSVLAVGSQELATRLPAARTTWLEAHLRASQAWARHALESHLPGPYPELTACVAASVIFGVHAAPPTPEISDAFRRAGTIHLLVVSGSMVSLVFAFIFLPGKLGLVWRQRRLAGSPSLGRGRVRFRAGVGAAVVAMGVVLYYAVLTEGGQAVWRAAAMGVIAGAAMVLRRVPRVARQHGLNVDGYTLLAAAALVLLLLDPEALFLPGFQLSFTAAWAILFLTPPMAARLRRLPTWLAAGLAGTVAAQLGTFPILVWHYGNAPLAGLAANLLAVPLAGVVLWAGMATCALAALAPPLASVAGQATAVATRGLVLVSRTVAAWPWACPELAQPPWLVLLLWYAALIALGARLHRRPGPAVHDRV